MYYVLTSVILYLQSADVCRARFDIPIDLVRVLVPVPAGLDPRVLLFCDRCNAVLPFVHVGRATVGV